MRTPAMIVADLLRSDAGRPRVTYYDEGTGERVELSGTVLDLWVAKAANLLTEEYDIGPGSVIALRLPGEHWRTLYWALAALVLGATLDFTDSSDPELIITDDPSTRTSVPTDRMIVVTLPALARRHPGPRPAGALDEAAEIAGYPDVLLGPGVAPTDEPAMITDEGPIGYDELVSGRSTGGRVRITGAGSGFVRRVLAVWAGDGSVVLINGADPDTLARRLAEERVDG